MHGNKFDPKKLQRLNDPDRLKDIPPDIIRGKLNLDKAEVLVEIGAGTAFFSKVFLEKFAARTVYACDMSEIMIGWIKAHVTPKHPGIVPVKSSESVIPLDDSLADLVFMINLHHELEDPTRMLEEAHRLLKAGGKIFIAEWLKKEMAEGPPVKIRWLSRDVKAQLVQAGFDNVRDDNGMAKHFLVIGEKGCRTR
ncbi:class I SAM-dependent methyltransferase [uncultured Desulfosarcina sp.]|uniref:class I SAM-dependent methyltransferase n=1 Tax=uncultured Desulfosarcina sp. TaxID=218289 RepID=UPI0029C8C508|nr:class I SAM-dependent methyltransferase [uncultured Desulfosarcina sp.]